MQKRKIRRKRTQHLRVPVLPEEKEIIEGQARKSGLSVAHYLRAVGQGFEPRSIIDIEQVMELARINGDLGRLGGLLKLWLSDDRRTAHYGKPLLMAVLRKIVTNQNKIGDIMERVVNECQ